MKILYLGQISPGQTALMRMRAIERLGHTVRGVHTMEPLKYASWIKRQVQRHSSVSGASFQAGYSVGG
jgi:hypothetical protein